MALDMAKYRRIFLEEAMDHLGEISRALLDLEKEMGSVEAIDTLFRMAHSIKSMAASLGYDPVSELAHRLEDRMEGIRASGRVRGPEELSILFRGLETLEVMVQAVANEEALVPADAGLLAELAATSVEDGPTLEDDSAGALVAADPLEAVGGEPKKVRS